MKLQFDANQPHQIDAIAALTDVFDGQPQCAPEYSVIQMGEWSGMFAGQLRTFRSAGAGSLACVGGYKHPAPPELRRF